MRKETTSWNNVARQYDKHLTQSADNYHNTLIIPKLTKQIRKFLPNKSSRIVDLACGQGIITRAILNDGYTVIGADVAPDLIKKAKGYNSAIEYYNENTEKLSDKFIEKNLNSSAITIVLAIQNIANLKVLIENCKKILRKDGYIFIVMNHPYFRIPKFTSWGFDGSEAQYRRVDAYMSNQKLEINMNPGESKIDYTAAEKTVSFHRPLQGYIKMFFESGFALVDMEEWISNKVSTPGRRAEAENIARNEIPLFMSLVFKIVK